MAIVTKGLRTHIKDFSRFYIVYKVIGVTVIHNASNDGEVRIESSYIIRVNPSQYKKQGVK
jgi:hypothetical protein